MKVNKVSHWIYCILMLLPFLTILFYVCYWGLSRNTLPTELSSYSNFTTMINSIGTNDLFGWVRDTSIYNTIDSFLMALDIDSGVIPLLPHLFTYWLVISMAYLGIEVLLAFLNIARKLVYAFVDKEF